MSIPALLLPLLLAQSPADLEAAPFEYAVVVHQDNPMTAISSERLRRIFRSEMREWPTGRTIELLLPRAGTDEKSMLLQKVYGMNDLQLRRYWLQLVYQNRIVDLPMSVPSATVALQIVGRTKGGVAVVPAKSPTERFGARVLAVDGLLPGQDGYPLSFAGEILALEKEPSSIEEASFVRPAARRDEGARPDETEQDSILRRLERLEASSDRPLTDFSLHGFGHSEFEVERSISKDGTERENGFSIEVLDLLFTARIGERATILSEVTFEENDDGENVTEIERLLVNYRFSDAFQVQMGRFLTGLGYWNSRYHHGEWLQVSIDRPEVLDFEDDSGLLPIHNVGLVFHGSLFTEAASYGYTVEIANGRGPTPEKPQVKEDANDPKAINVSLAVEPSCVRGLRLGGGAYFDEIPPNDDPGDGNLHGELDELILNAFAVYQRGNWEVMAEFFDLEHDDGSTETNSSGWYVQAARSCGLWTPYVRLDGLRRDDDELFWEVPEDTRTRVLGVRYDAAEWLALTLHYERTDIDAPAGDLNERTNTVVLQASFTF